MDIINIGFLILFLAFFLSVLILILSVSYSVIVGAQLSKFYRAYLKLLFWKNFFFILEMVLFTIFLLLRLLLIFLSIKLSMGYYFLYGMCLSFFFSILLLRVSTLYFSLVFYIWCFYANHYARMSINTNWKLWFNARDYPYFWKNTFFFLKKYRFTEYFLIYFIFGFFGIFIFCLLIWILFF